MFLLQVPISIFEIGHWTFGIFVPIRIFSGKNLYYLVLSLSKGIQHQLTNSLLPCSPDTLIPLTLSVASFSLRLLCLFVAISFEFRILLTCACSYRQVQAFEFVSDFVLRISNF